MIEAFARETTLVTALTPPAAEAAIAAVFLNRRRGRRGPIVHEGLSRFYVGSMLRFRMFGVFGRDAWRRLPVRIDARIESEGDGSRVELLLQSVQQYNIGQPELVRNLYEVAFERTVEAVRDELTPRDDERPPEAERSPDVG